MIQTCVAVYAWIPFSMNPRAHVSMLNEVLPHQAWPHESRAHLPTGRRRHDRHRVSVRHRTTPPSSQLLLSETASACGPPACPLVPGSAPCSQPLPPKALPRTPIISREGGVPVGRDTAREREEVVHKWWEQGYEIGELSVNIPVVGSSPTVKRNRILQLYCIVW